MPAKKQAIENNIITATKEIKTLESDNNSKKGSDSTDSVDTIQRAFEANILSDKMEIVDSKELDSKLANYDDQALKSDDNSNALHIIIKKEDLAALKYKLQSITIDQAKILIYQEDANGSNPFHYAAHTGVEYSKLLLEYGADINAINSKFHNTALHYAVMRTPDENVIDLLISNNVNVEAENIDKNTALQLAISYKNVTAVNSLIKNMNNEQTLKPPLYVHVLRNDLHEVEAWFNDADIKDKKINEPAPNGETLLHIASGMGHTNIVKLLINQKADVNRPTCLC